jgi:hypothetical protein
MRQLALGADTTRALDEALYVSFPGAAGGKIAGRLELRPSSTHLLVGGVGSGKTTELLEVRRLLGPSDDTKALYVDVTKEHDISKLVPGAVAVQVGLAIVGFLRELVKARTGRGVAEHVERSLHAVERLAKGYHYDPATYEEWDDDGPMAHREGILVSPDRLSERVEEVRESIAGAIEEASAGWISFVALVDGLDRLNDIAAFEQVVDEDMRALAAVGVGVVLVGPLRCLYRTERTIADAFDDFEHQPWRDPAGDPLAARLLGDLLRKRLPADALELAAADKLVRFSGGVLRDLLALAQLACEEAYFGGADTVLVAHVDAAIEAFGRKHVLGLQDDELQVLQRVRLSGIFIHTSDKELSLLMTRRVLEYADGAARRYIVHPTIEELLRRLADKASP